MVLSVAGSCTSHETQINHMMAGEGKDTRGCRWGVLVQGPAAGMEAPPRAALSHCPALCLLPAVKHSLSQDGVFVLLRRAPVIGPALQYRKNLS